ncbi:MAG: FAD-binding oxidoreductase [Bacteroidetes bacterium]|nr:FAD-binding oxidoreductase [Bacteroidota bacterium]
MRQRFLIIGAGIAGLTVAQEILKKGGEVTLIDSGVNHSSRIAAGQINPLVFRRMTKSWRVDEFLPFARNYYEELEKQTGRSILVHSTIRRLFAHEQEKELWLVKQDLEEFEPYMEKITPNDLNFVHAKNTFGSGRVKQSFFVNSENFLDSALSELLKSTNFQYVKAKFDYHDLNVNTGEYKGVYYDKIIFCEGFQNKDNPWFQAIKIDPTKGQVLTIQSDSIYSEESLNRKCFVIPTANNIFKVGSTYEWHNDTIDNTDTARLEIEENLKTLVSESYTVVEQKAGIRPTTYDRRPILGIHPEHERLAIFNGLGAKGYLIAPFLAQEFAAYLIESKPLDREVLLARFYKK